MKLFDKWRLPRCTVCGYPKSNHAFKYKGRAIRTVGSGQHPYISDHFWSDPDEQTPGSPNKVHN